MMINGQMTMMLDGNQSIQNRTKFFIALIFLSLSISNSLIEIICLISSFSQDIARDISICYFMLYMPINIFFSHFNPRTKTTYYHKGVCRDQLSITHIFLILSRRLKPCVCVNVFFFDLSDYKNERRKKIRKGVKSLEYFSHNSPMINYLRIFHPFEGNDLNKYLYMSVTILDERRACPRLVSLSRSLSFVYIYTLHFFLSYIQGHIYIFFSE